MTERAYNWHSLVDGAGELGRCSAVKYPSAVRYNLLGVAAATLAGSLMFLLPGFPFPAGFCAASAASFLMHAAAFLVFNRISSSPAVFEAMTLADIGLLGFIVHYTGGIISPFVFFYFWILASALIYGIRDRFFTYFALLTYSAVVACEFSGLLPPWGSSSREVYASTLSSGLLLAAILFFMTTTRYVTGLVIFNLRATLLRENAEKEALLKKFAELDSTAQIGVLAHRIAHDLRVPVSAISGYIQVETARTSDPATTAMLHELGRMVDEMAADLAGITSFGRGRDKGPEEIELTDFIDNLMVIAAYSPNAKWVKFVKRYQPGRSCRVRASRADLQQACFNILKNAVEAVADNPGDKTVIVDVRQAPGEAEILIEDDGPGMPPEILRSVFTRSVTTKKAGSGVGLIIAHDLMLRNQGMLELRNGPAGGLSASLRLPAL